MSREMRATAFSPDGSMLAGGGEDHQGVRLWSTNDQDVVADTDRPSAAGSARSPSTRTAASSPRRATTGEVRLWDALHGRAILCDARARGAGRTRSAYSPDGEDAGVVRPSQAASHLWEAGDAPERTRGPVAVKSRPSTSIGGGAEVVQNVAGSVRVEPGGRRMADYDPMVERRWAFDGRTRSQPPARC